MHGRYACVDIGQHEGLPQSLLILGLESCHFDDCSTTAGEKGVSVRGISRQGGRAFLDRRHFIQAILERASPSRTSL